MCVPRSPFILILPWLVLGAFASAAAAQQVEPSLEHVATLLEFGRSADAVVVCQTLVERAPEDVAARVELARASMLDRRFDEAVQACAQCDGLELTDAVDADVQGILGEAHRKAGRAADAYAAFETAKEHAEAAGETAKDALFVALRGLATYNWVLAPGEKSVMYVPPDTKLTDPTSLVRAFDQMVGRLQQATGGVVPGPIEVYCFNDYDQWKLVLGEQTKDWGVPRERSIHYMLGRTMYNTMRQLAHYLGAPELKAEPKPNLLTNGLAAYLAGGRNWGGRVAQTAPGLLKENQLPPLAELLQAESESNTLAAIGGSLVKYLLSQYGQERFHQLWCSFNDQPDAVQAAYGRSLEDLDAEWRAQL